MQRIRARWLIFSAAPHRMFFWMGSLYAVVAVTVWTVQQASLHTALLDPIFWEIPYPQAHAFMMIYGLFGFYFFGFLLTTFPRWLDDQAISRRTYLSAWVCLSVGSHAFWIGLFWHVGLSIAGGLLMMLGYGIATASCTAMLLRATTPGRGRQAGICLGLALGIVGMAAALTAIGTGDPAGYRVAKWLGIYGFLLMVILPVIYRMVPFFTSTVTPGYQLRRTEGLIPLFMAALLLRGVLAALDWPAFFWLADGALFGLLVWELVVWRAWQVRGPALLVILYVALGWFLLSFALSAGGSLWVLLGQADVPPLRTAALHALTLGGLGTLLLGISTRVTLGHSGRGLSTTPAINALLYGFQLAPVSRIVPEIAELWLPGAVAHGFWSGVLWVLIFAAWFLGVGTHLLRPRSDGRPG